MKNRLMISFLVVLMAVGGVVLFLTNQVLMEQLCQEDGMIETLTAVVYVIAGGLFVLANRQFALRNVWMWGFALLFFLVAGEEISWGQRIIGIKTPNPLVQVNTQEEINLHNIEGIHGNVRALALLVIFGISFVVPISNRAIAHLRRFYETVKMPIFPLWSIGIVAVAVLLMAIPRLMFHTVIFELDELGEFILSLAFFIFATAVYRQSIPHNLQQSIANQSEQTAVS